MVELAAKQADVFFRAVALLAAVNDPLNVIGPEVDEDTVVEPLTVFVGGAVAIRDGFMDPGIFPFAPFLVEVGKGDLPGLYIVGTLVIVVQSGQCFFPCWEIAKILINLFPVVRPSGGDADRKGAAAFPAQFDDRTVTRGKSHNNRLHDE